MTSRCKKSATPAAAIWKINDLKWDDITEYPQLGTTEIWRFINDPASMHPMHMHLVFFQVLDRIRRSEASPPIAARSDRTSGLEGHGAADPGEITRVIARFEDYTGKYAYHCHILEHEDHEMMRQFWSVGAIEQSLDGTNVNWGAQPGAAGYGYDVARGDLFELRATGGNFAFPSVTETCLASAAMTTSVDDGDSPLPGEGFWYLVRSIDAGGPSTYESGSSHQPDLRDDEIAASGNDCP